MTFQVDKEGGINIEDAAGFFANVFGGERFVDYVRNAHHLVVLVLIIFRSARFPS